MRQTNVIKMIPIQESADVVKALRVKGIWAQRRGRGPRPKSKAWHGGRQYQAYLPLNMSTHCSIYFTDRGHHTCPRTHWDYLGWEADKAKPRVKFVA